MSISAPFHLRLPPKSVDDGCPTVAEFVEAWHSVRSAASGRGHCAHSHFDEYLYSKDWSEEISRSDSTFAKLRFVIAEQLRMDWRPDLKSAAEVSIQLDG